MSPPIIDTHIHLFRADHLPHLAWMTPDNPLNGPHSLSEYLSSIPASYRANLKGFLFVETDRAYNTPSAKDLATMNEDALREAWKWPLEEFEFVRSLAADAAGERLLLGIVPWAPVPLGRAGVEAFYGLMVPEEEDKTLLRGFRYLVQNMPRGTFLADGFVDGLKWIREQGLAFDIGVDVRSGGMWQLEEAVSAIDRVIGETPEGKGGFVINHLAKPPLEISPSAPSTISAHPTFLAWCTHLRALAAHPSVSIKLSGIFSELPTPLPSSSSNPTTTTTTTTTPNEPSNQDSFGLTPSTIDSIISTTLPWVRAAITIFSPQRVLWGSDWPVCNVGFQKLLPTPTTTAATATSTREGGGGGEEGEGEGSSGAVSRAWECWRFLTERLLEELVKEGVMKKEDVEGVWGGNAVEVYGLEV